jgi:hypothetical protein
MLVGCRRRGQLSFTEQRDTLKTGGLRSSTPNGARAVTRYVDGPAGSGQPFSATDYDGGINRQIRGLRESLFLAREAAIRIRRADTTYIVRAPIPTASLGQVSVRQPEPRPSTALDRDAGGRFAPGHSGNVGGRPKQLREVVALARECTVEAIGTLREIALDRNTQPMARVKACESLLLRGWGAPMRETNVEALLDGDDEEVTFALVLGPKLSRSWEERAT